MIIIQANGKTDATEVIADSGFTDVFPDMEFYDTKKVYKRDGKYYIFAGWNGKTIKGKWTAPSLNMEEVDFQPFKE